MQRLSILCISLGLLVAGCVAYQPYVYRISLSPPGSSGGGAIATAPDQRIVAGMIEGVLQREGFKPSAERGTEWGKAGALVAWNSDATNETTLRVTATARKKALRNADAIELELLRRLTAEPLVVVRREYAPIQRTRQPGQVSSNMFPWSVLGTNAIPRARP